jgi:hypothetical protein
VGLFKQKDGVNLEFKKLNSRSNKINIVDDTINDNIDIDISEKNISILNLSGAPSSSVVGIKDLQTLTNKTLNSPVLTTPKINDISANHKYVLSVSELSQDRTIRLPLLSENDTFVFNNHSQTLKNKIISTSSNTITVSASDVAFGTFADARIASSNVTQYESLINHNNLLGFISKEHIDWTQDAEENIIHDNNISESSIIQHETSINHNNLVGFVVNEHIDWTQDANENNIHDNNILSSSITQHENLITIGNLSGAPSSSVVGVSDHQIITNKTFTDNVTYFQDNVDNSKKFKFDVSGLTSSTTRILSVPDAHTVIVGVNTEQTLTNKTIESSTNEITVSTDDIVSGILPILRGGTGQSNKVESFNNLAPTTSKGDIIVHNGTDNIKLSVGTDGQALTIDSNETSGLRWSYVGLGDITSTSSISANSIIIGDNGSKGVKDSKWSISSNGVLSSGFSHAGYILDVHNTLSTGGGNGFRILAGETLGDIAFHVADADDTFQIMELEADRGFVTFGKTYAQTLTSNGTVYGIDVQHTSGTTTDFNTQVGTYRIGGVDVVMPAGGSTGQILEKVDSTDYNTQWVSNTKTFRQGHTWTVVGDVKIADDNTDYLIPFFISLSSGQTAKIVKARYRINSGTSVTVTVQKNNVDVAGLTDLLVTTTTTTTDPSDIILSDDDQLSLIVTSSSGSPKNMTFTLFIEHTF